MATKTDEQPVEKVPVAFQVTKDERKRLRLIAAEQDTTLAGIAREAVVKTYLNGSTAQAA